MSTIEAPEPEIEQDRGAQLMLEMRTLLDQVKEIDRALGQANKSGRSPEGDKQGSPGFREWKAARSRVKDEILSRYRAVRTELNQARPGFDINQAIMTTRLLRRTTEILERLAEELEDGLDADEQEVLNLSREHLRSI